LRRILYGLYAIIKLHLAKEEEIYLPILELRLLDSAVNDLAAAMEGTVNKAKSSLRTLNPRE
jgi:hypothetical protein